MIFLYRKVFIWHDVFVQKTKKKILIVSASAGHGHVVAAQALEEALSKHPDKPEFQTVDILEYSTTIYRKMVKDAYLFLAKKNPNLFGYIYYTTNRELNIKQARNDKFLKMLEGLNTGAFMKFLKVNTFDHIISTHYLPPQVIERLKLKNKIHCPVTTVTTDYGLHTYWVSPGSDYFVTADKNNKKHLVAAGVDNKRILASGIPVRQTFYKKKDISKLKKKYNCSAKDQVVLVLSGGLGVGPIQEILGEVDKATSDFKIFVIAGRNEKLQASLEDQSTSLNHPTTVIGYTEKIDEYMRIADIIVTKPGGLTVAESLAVGTPLMIINPIPGQESFNSDMLLEEGAAVKAFGSKQISYKMDAVFSKKGKLSSLKKNAKRIGNPKAAIKIAEFVLKHC